MPNLVRNMSFVVLAVLSLPISAADEAGFLRLNSTPAEVLGPGAETVYGGIMDGDQEIEWQVYLPEHQGAGTKPGVLVGTGFFDKGDLPMHWKSILDQRNLIWISATSSWGGRNNRAAIIRAFLSPVLVGRKYAVDRNRIYLVGGGDISNYIAATFPELFRGVIHAYQEERLDKVDGAKLDLMKSNRYVFWSKLSTGSAFSARGYESYRNANIGNSLHSPIPGGRRMDSQFVSKTIFEQTIAYLDDPSSADR